MSASIGPSWSTVMAAARETSSRHERGDGLRSLDRSCGQGGMSLALTAARAVIAEVHEGFCVSQLRDKRVMPKAPKALLDRHPAEGRPPAKPAIAHPPARGGSRPSALCRSSRRRSGQHRVGPAVVRGDAGCPPPRPKRLARRGPPDKAGGPGPSKQEVPAPGGVELLGAQVAQRVASELGPEALGRLRKRLLRPGGAKRVAKEAGQPQRPRPADDLHCLRERVAATCNAVRGTLRELDVEATVGLGLAPALEMPPRPRPTRASSAPSRCSEPSKARTRASTYSIAASRPGSSTRRFTVQDKAAEEDVVAILSAHRQSREPTSATTMSPPPTALHSSRMPDPYTTMESSVVGAPPRGFVVNVRRLILVRQLFEVLHMFISSIALAALTMVRAGSARQTRTSCCFLAGTVILFRMHSSRYDLTTIKALLQLYPLLVEDVNDHDGQAMCNRVLKGLHLLKRHEFNAWREKPFVFPALVATAFIGVSILWIAYGWRWEAIAKTQDDSETLGRSLLVFMFMFLIHICFELVYRWETRYIMPSTPSGSVWDPRRDGLPGLCSVLGLPSMWFTSAETYEDVLQWVELSQAESTAPSERLFPEELALLAVSSEEKRQELQRELKQARLYDGHRLHAVKLMLQGANVLGVELVFYDSKMWSSDGQYEGEFMQVQERPSEIVRSGALHHLTRRSSSTKVTSGLRSGRGALE